MNCTVISNQKLSSCYYKLTLNAKEIAQQAKPGQFVMLWVNNGYDPLLRRPFALHHMGANGNIELIYQVVGRGTSLMTTLLMGTNIDVLGPLGFGFRLPATSPPAVLLVAGAIGVAPLLPWAQELLKKHKFSPEQLILMVGGKSSRDIIAVSDFSELGIEVQVATEDGSLGEKGLVTNLVANYLHSYPLPIFACGPTGMLKAVAQLSEKYKVPCQVSLEAMMACGVGACQGCVIKVKDEAGFGSFGLSQAESLKGIVPHDGVQPLTGFGLGTSRNIDEAGFKYQRVCTEGPVFEANQIIWTDNVYGTKISS